MWWNLGWMMWAGWFSKWQLQKLNSSQHEIESRVRLGCISRVAQWLHLQLKEVLVAWCEQFDFCTYPCSNWTLPNMTSNWGWRMWAGPTTEEIKHVMEYGLDDVRSSIFAVITAKTELFPTVRFNAKTELFPTWNRIQWHVGLHQQSRSMFTPATNM